MLHGSDCRNVLIHGLHSFVDIRTGNLGAKFLRETQRSHAKMKGFVTPEGVQYEFEFPFWAISNDRPF